MGHLKNYYDVLEIERFAEADTVKSAFRKLARQYHPDLNAGNKSAEEKFKEINEAYEVLSHPEKRIPYDQSLSLLLNVKAPSSQAASSRKSEKKPPPPPTPQAAKPAPEKTSPKAPDGPASSTSINDLFENFKKNFQPGPENKSNPKAGSKPHPDPEKIFQTEKGRRGEDVTVEAFITPAEADDGVIKTVNVQHNELCRRCAGTGRVNGLSCSGCHGEKVFSRLKKIDVRIPPGVKQGSKVRIAAEGGRGPHGGDPGDLFLLIRIQAAPVTRMEGLRIEGLNVYCDLPLSIVDAVLGTELEVPTLSGKVTMAIPPLTSSGKVFRLREQGVQNGQTRGDQFVTVQIMAPETLSPKEKELYGELAKLRLQKK